MKCFYHSADMDGHCSGAIVKSFAPECKMVGINYGEPFPWDSITPKEEVYMVDFSLQPFSEMVGLNGVSTLNWIDHHKTAIEEYQSHTAYFKDRARFARVELDSDFAACELTWRRLYPCDEMPQSVQWLGRYDIWKHADHPGALEFQYGVRMYDTRPDNQAFWSTLFTDEATERIRAEGELLLRYETEQNRKFIAAYGFECEVDGLRCIAANKGFTNSLVFASRYDPTRHDAMLAFAYKGGKWSCSLYADKPDVDVSAVCKARGGGGHKGAAGFQCDTLPFTLA